MNRATIVMLLVAGCVTTALAAETGPNPETLLLKDFHPASVYNIPQTKVEKAKYRVIDMHAHTYAKTPEQVAQWVRVMDEAGIPKTIILTGATGKQFDSVFEMYSKYPNRFELWCGFDYTDMTSPTSVRRPRRNWNAVTSSGPAASANSETKARGSSTAVRGLSTCTRMTPGWTPCSRNAPSWGCLSISTWPIRIGCISR